MSKKLISISVKKNSDIVFKKGLKHPYFQQVEDMGEEIVFYPLNPLNEDELKLKIEEINNQYLYKNGRSFVLIPIQVISRNFEVDIVSVQNPSGGNEIQVNINDLITVTDKVKVTLLHEESYDIPQINLSSDQQYLLSLYNLSDSMQDSRSKFILYYSILVWSEDKDRNHKSVRKFLREEEWTSRKGPNGIVLKNPWPITIRDSIQYGDKVTEEDLRIGKMRGLALKRIRELTS